MQSKEFEFIFYAIDNSEPDNEFHLDGCKILAELFLERFPEKTADYANLLNLILLKFKQ